ncbi:MAG TPA: ATP-dependent helicase [Acidimicrobiales bacterium]|nr:ATP-dependent helicase [Acidimicrobiales bacterium]
MPAEVPAEGLDDAQREAVTTTAAPLCILAGAGSGKTRVLTRRIAHRITEGTADASHVLAVTFTRKAAGELRSRLVRLGVRDRVAAGTFHALALAQLQHWWDAQGKRPPAIMERKRRMLERLGLPASVGSQIEWAKARMLTPADVGDPFVADAFQRYEDEKRKRGVVDFDDLLLLCAQALEGDRAFAEAQRWRFRHLFVDEFQDVNPAQFRLLQAWLGDRPDLCVVGDPNQAIYGWNGADPELLARFPSRFPGATVVRLDGNYRSTAQIVAAAAAVLPPAAGRSRAMVDIEGPVPVVAACRSEADEAAHVVREARLAHRPGRAWSQIAVLARTNAQLEPLAQALRAAGIPCQRPWSSTAAAGVEGLRAAPPRVRLASYRHEVEGEMAVAVDDYLAIEPDATVADFLAWLPGSGMGEVTQAADAVHLTTFHRAKGLEWEVVFAVGLEAGLMPLASPEEPAALEEERRLLYVALSRATRELHCTWAEQRAVGAGGKPMARTRSPFLAPVAAACAALERGRDRSALAPVVDARARFAQLRQRLADADAAATAGR